MQSTLLPDTVSTFVGAPTNATEFWQMVGSIADAAAFLATIVLIVVAVKGLKSLSLAQRSLKLAQTDMENRARRDARACAIERSRELAEKIIPANFIVLASLSRAKIGVFVTDASKVSFNSNDEREARGPAAEWYKALAAHPTLYARCIDVLNSLESWSMYFTKGLADGDAVSRPCSPVLSGIVIQLYPVLVHLRNDTKAGEFPNLVELFEVWYGERVREQNAKEAQELLERVKHLQTKEYRTLPDPIGTKLDTQDSS